MAQGEATFDIYRESDIEVVASCVCVCVCVRTYMRVLKFFLILF